MYTLALIYICWPDRISGHSPQAFYRGYIARNLNLWHRETNENIGSIKALYIYEYIIITDLDDVFDTRFCLSRPMTSRENSHKNTWFSRSFRLFLGTLLLSWAWICRNVKVDCINDGSWLTLYIKMLIELNQSRSSVGGSLSWMKDRGGVGVGPQSSSDQIIRYV